MERIPLIAVKALPYDRKLRLPGDEFDALPKHAEFFQKKGVARLKDEDPKPVEAKRKYVRKDLKKYETVAMVAQD